MKSGSLEEERIVIQFDAMARKIALKYTGTVDFDDLYQVARMAIWSARKTYDPKKGNLVKHLYMCATYAVLDHLKTERGGGIRIPADGGTLKDNPPGPRPQCISNDARAEIESDSSNEDFKTLEQRETLKSLCQLAKLTTKQAEVIQMLFVNGMTFGEVVKSLGCTEQNVHYLRKSALEKIREAANGQGLTPEDLLG